MRNGRLLFMVIIVSFPDRSARATCHHSRIHGKTSRNAPDSFSFAEGSSGEQARCQRLVG
jgi:hypothetical protein